MAREYRIENAAGNLVRKADVAGLRNGVPVEFHQVGLMNRGGSAVSRERDALLDIYDLTGIWPEFHPYGIRR